MTSRAAVRVAAGFVWAALLTFPLLRPEIYFVRLSAGLFMYIALAESWNLLGGYTGYLSLGQVTFFGIGAYTSAFCLSQYELSPFLTAPLGGLLSVALAVAIGYPSLRLRGPYFSVTTLSIAFLAQVAASNITQVGGGFGIQLPSLKLPVWVTEAVFYWTFLLIAAVAVWTARTIERSRFGLGLLAIRSDEEAAEVFGVRVVRAKLFAFALSALFPGILGGIFAYHISYIEPRSAFDIGLSIDMLLMSMFGGAGIWYGPIAGAALVYLLSQILVFVIPSELNRVVFGIILALVVYAMPHGIVGFIQSWSARLKPGVQPLPPKNAESDPSRPTS
jgi:branched-chain amino acid transport system permease protein